MECKLAKANKQRRISEKDELVILANLCWLKYKQAIMHRKTTLTKVLRLPKLGRKSMGVRKIP